MQRWQKAGFGLYVHWPYCLSKCPYCDFNSHVANSVDIDQWRKAYLAEILRYRELYGPRVLSSIFFGGGTPSLMPPSLVADIIDAATDAWSPSNNIEITIEANPTSVEVEKLKSFRAAGVNRASIGIQALNDADLRRLGRTHDAKSAIAAIEITQRIFDRSSFDLIYARQDQSLSDWQAELSTALSIAKGHLSLYQLTIEQGTVFGERHKRGLLRGLPDEDRSVALYELTQEMCAASSRPAYEVSNHAQKGEESVHNTIYWKSGDYAGIGPGAHGRITDGDGNRIATSAYREPNKWLQAVLAHGSGERENLVLSRLECLDEYLLMGMRLREGISLAGLADFCGYTINERTVLSLAEDGLVDASGGLIEATPRGRLLLNQVIEHLSAGAIEYS